MTQEALKLALEFIENSECGTADLEARIKEALAQYERGFIDGMQKQAQSSVDKAVNAMSQRTWVGLTAEQMLECNMDGDFMVDRETAKLNVQAKLKELNT